MVFLMEFTFVLPDEFRIRASISQESIAVSGGSLESEYMAYGSIDEEPWDEDSSEDIVDDDVSETVPCPECGQPVYEDAVQCPSCGNYISPSASHASDRPRWWILLGFLAALAAFLWYLARGMIAPH